MQCLYVFFFFLSLANTWSDTLTSYFTIILPILPLPLQHNFVTSFITIFYLHLSNILIWEQHRLTKKYKVSY